MSRTDARARAPLDGARQHPSRTLSILVLAATAYALSQTIIVPALPAIQEDTGASQATAIWLVTAFLLAASVSTPMLGRLGDMYGKHRLLLVALIFFGLGSAICAIGSHSIEALICGRLVQGAGGAIFPLSFGIVRDEFPHERVAGSVGFLSSTFGIGGGIGLVLAGVCVDHLSVAWLFWTSLAVTTVAAWATWRFVPESPVRAPAGIDWLGAALLSAGLVAVLLGVSQGPGWGWASPGVVALIAGGLAVLSAFIAYERRVPHPLVDMALMGSRSVWSANLAAFLISFAMFGSFVLIPQLVEAPQSTGYGFGLSATAAGLVMLPSSLVMLLGGALAGALGHRRGSRLPFGIGAGLCSVAYVALASLHDDVLTIIGAGAVLGLGISFAFAALANLVVAAVDQTQTGIATGLYAIVRAIGGAVGAQVAASLLASHVIAGGFVAETGYTSVFLMSGVAALVALVSCTLIPRRRAGDFGAPAALRA